MLSDFTYEVSTVVVSMETMQNGCFESLGGRGRGVVVKGDRVSVGTDEKLLGTASGEGYTAVWNTDVFNATKFYTSKWLKW